MPAAPGIVCYRQRITAATVETRDLEFTGGEHCDLFLDGERTAAGPEHTLDRRHLRFRYGRIPAGTHWLAGRLCVSGGESIRQPARIMPIPASFTRRKCRSFSERCRPSNAGRVKTPLPAIE